MACVWEVSEWLRMAFPFAYHPVPCVEGSINSRGTVKSSKAAAMRNLPAERAEQVRKLSMLNACLQLIWAIGDEAN